MCHTFNLSGARWRKSSYSGGQPGDACVEVAEGISGLVPVRDSKVSHGPVVIFTEQAWISFTASARLGAIP